MLKTSYLTINQLFATQLKKTLLVIKLQFPLKQNCTQKISLLEYYNFSKPFLKIFFLEKLSTILIIFKQFFFLPKNPGIRAINEFPKQNRLRLFY